MERSCPLPKPQPIQSLIQWYMQLQDKDLFLGVTTAPLILLLFCFPILQSYRLTIKLAPVRKQVLYRNLVCLHVLGSTRENAGYIHSWAATFKYEVGVSQFWYKIAASTVSLRITPMGFEVKRGNGNVKLMLLPRLWVIQSFVSDPELLCLLLVSNCPWIICQLGSKGNSRHLKVLHKHH